MPLGPDDYLEIQGLYARYCQLVDGDQHEEWARLFTPDGVFLIQGTPGAQDRVMRGTAELVAFQQGLAGNFRKRGLRQFASNIVIEPAEGGARAAAYLTAVRVGDQQPPQVTVTGIYADELVKYDDGWRFKSRSFRRDF